MSKHGKSKKLVKKPVSSGSLLEMLVARELASKGLKVDRNVKLKHGFRKTKAEIDLVVNKTFWIECKYRDHALRLEDVSKFVAVVELFNHPRELSAIITNHSYTERALDYCSQKNIATFTLQDLEGLYLYIQKSLYGLPKYYLEVLKRFAKQLFKF
ncbi:restriction endonuclease [Candidatus Woesearchaeota archaeon]|nr:restriction endonuclease [Candidatus Woesearchaeota archaeon]